MSIDDHDDRQRYCPQLGHAVPFSYCRKMADGIPCRRVLDCWQGYFDATSFIRDHYSSEQIRVILTPPKPRITSILEMIERAKKVKDQANESDS